MSEPQHPDVSQAASLPLPASPGLPEPAQIEVVQSGDAAKCSVREEKNVGGAIYSPANGRPILVTDGPQYEDPLSLGQHKKPNVSQKQLKVDHPKANKRKLKKFYTRQNDLIDTFLQSGDEERMAVLDMELNGPKIKFAIYASSGVNFCLFIIQLYAAISTGSLSLFATAADAFVGLIEVKGRGDLLTSFRWILCLPL